MFYETILGEPDKYHHAAIGKFYFPMAALPIHVEENIIKKL